MSVLTKGLAMDFERQGLKNMSITSLWPAVVCVSLIIRNRWPFPRTNKRHFIRCPTYPRNQPKNRRSSPPPPRDSSRPTPPRRGTCASLPSLATPS